MPAALAAAVNAPFASPEILIAGWATAAELSAVRRKVTCAISSAAISRAYWPTMGSLVKLTARGGLVPLVETAPWAPAVAPTYHRQSR